MLKAMKFVHLKSMRDLVMLVASSPTMNVIQHLQTEDIHLYFIIGGTLSEIFLYFVKEEKAIAGDFITYNTYTGAIGSSERILHEPNINSFPLVEIENQDLLPEELLSRVNSL
jgi:predicted transcriptional regulator